MVQSVPARLADHARRFGDAQAIRVIGPAADTTPPLTYARLHHQTQLIARRIDQRFPGDTTLLLSSANRPELVPVFLGVLAAGRRLFPVSEALTAYELADLARRSGAAALLTDDPARRAGVVPSIDLIQWVAEVSAQAPPPPAFFDRSDHAWLLLQSSGTTGGPKIVRRSGPSLAAVARNVAHAVGLRPHPAPPPLPSLPSLIPPFPAAGLDAI